MHRITRGRVTKRKNVKSVTGYNNNRTISTRLMANSKRINRNIDEVISNAILETLTLICNWYHTNQAPLNELITADTLSEELSYNELLTYKLSSVQDTNNQLIKNLQHNPLPLQIHSHPVDTFFALMSDSVKTFPPIEQHFIKDNLFSMVNEIERKQFDLVKLKESQQTNQPVEETNLKQIETCQISQQTNQPDEMKILKQIETRQVSQQTSLHLPPFSQLLKYNNSCAKSSTKNQIIEEDHTNKC